MLPVIRLVPLLVILGCAKKVAPVEPPPPPPDPWPELVCPDGAEKVGASPPTGFHVWCRLQLPSGKWVKEGGAVDFHDEGELLAKGTYQQDKKVGTWLTFYPSGEVHIESRYEDGAANGLWLELHENGQKKAEGNMLLGKREGAWVYWHDNGQKRLEGMFTDDAEEGQWLEYNAEGQLVAERYYKFGRLLSQKAYAP